MLVRLNMQQEEYRQGSSKIQVCNQVHAHSPLMAHADGLLLVSFQLITKIMMCFFGPQLAVCQFIALYKYDKELCA
jgi:hypothetical protein